MLKKKTERSHSILPLPRGWPGTSALRREGHGPDPGHRLGGPPPPRGTERAPRLPCGATSSHHGWVCPRMELSFDCRWNRYIVLLFERVSGPSKSRKQQNSSDAVLLAFYFMSLTVEIKAGAVSLCCPPLLAPGLSDCLTHDSLSKSRHLELAWPSVCTGLGSHQTPQTGC